MSLYYICKQGVLIALFCALSMVHIFPAKSSHATANPLQKEIEFVENKYRLGHYEEATHHAVKILHKLGRESSETSLTGKVYLTLLLARVYEARLLIEKVKTAEEKVRAWTVNNNQAEPWLYWGEYLLERGRGLEAEEAYRQGMRWVTTKKQETAFTLLKLEVEFKQGYVQKAAKNIADQEKVWANILSEEKIIQPSDQQRYIRFLNLKSRILIQNGQLNEAIKNINNTYTWLKNIAGTKHHLHVEIVETEIAWWRAKGLPHEFYKAYAKAYFIHPASEYAVEKLYLLCKTAEYSLEAGDLAAFAGYQRKLQMNAAQYIGKKDWTHLAYQYIQACHLYHKRSYEQAIQIINKLSEQLSYIPTEHRFTEMLSSLKEKVCLKSWNLKDYKNTLEKNILILHEKHGAEAPVVSKEQIRLAIFNTDYELDINKAEAIFKKHFYERNIHAHIGNNDPDYLPCLKSLAELYGKLGKYDSAQVTATLLKEKTASLHGANSMPYIEACTHELYYRLLTGDFTEVKARFTALKEEEKKLPYTAYSGKQRAIILCRLSDIARMMGETEQAKLYSLKTQRYLPASQYEIDDPITIHIWEQAGRTYMETGNYYKAEVLFKRNMDFQHKTMQDHQSSLVLPVYAGLAKLYIATGNYGEADKYLRLLSDKIQTLTYSKEIWSAEITSLYGDYFLSLRDLKRAEEKYRQSAQTITSLFGSRHIQTALSLLDVVAVSSALSVEKNKENEKIYLNAGTTIHTALGKDNVLYAEYLQKTAEFYIRISRYKEATDLLIEADRYWKSQMGASNRQSADIAAEQGNIAYILEDYEKAENFYQTAAKIYRELFDKKHPAYAKVMGRQARTHYMRKDITRSYKIMEEVVTLYLDYTEKYFPALSFSEKEKFWYSQKEEFEFYTFLILTNLALDKPQLTGHIYDQVIATKALLLTSDIKMRQRIATSGDTTLIRMFNEWVEKRELITSAQALTQTQLKEQEIHLEKETELMEHLEKTMSARSSLFQDNRKKASIHWQDIKAKLLDSEYAIEMVRFRYFDKIFTDSILYAALILKRDRGHPEWVLMPDGKKMEQRFLKLYRNAIIFNTEDHYSYEYFWKPLKTHIPDGAVLYFSGEGIYNQINLEIIRVPDKNQYVIDENEIILVTNTKDLLNRKREKNNKRPEGGEYVLCGNPDFYEEPLSQPNIPPLPGAEQEVLDIHAVLQKSGKQTIQLLNEAVTEDTLKQLTNPYLFHIATHGYFTEESAGNNPLLNSGLLLTGGGNIIDHPDNNHINFQSGVLTAYEALNLNFDYTQLVILSACETGRGELQIGEGVMGLQRSFLIAGADAVIMSLFKVNDETTRRFMLIFYTELLETGDHRKAFLHAKRKIKQEYDNPIYWGAFVMIETHPKTHSQ